MHNYTHKTLVETIKHLDTMPDELEKYSEWITADSHLSLIRENAGSEEIIIFANSEYTYIDSIVVPNKLLASISPDQLNQWHFRSYDSAASYTYGGGKDNVWIERGVGYSYGAEEKATQLVFHRTFDGLAIVTAQRRRQRNSYFIERSMGGAVQAEITLK